MCYTAIKLKQDKVKAKIEKEVQGSENWMKYMYRFFDLDYQLIQIRNENKKEKRNRG